MHRDGNVIRFDEADIAASQDRLPPSVPLASAHVLLRELTEEAGRLTDQGLAHSDSEMQQDWPLGMQELKLSTELSRLAAGIRREMNPPRPAPTLPIDESPDQGPPAGYPH